MGSKMDPKVVMMRRHNSLGFASLREANGLANRSIGFQHDFTTLVALTDVVSGVHRNNPAIFLANDAPLSVNHRLGPWHPSSSSVYLCILIMKCERLP
jgi:hypothetical protein